MEMRAELDGLLEEEECPVPPEKLEAALKTDRLRHVAESLREDLRRSSATADRLGKIVQKQEEAMQEMDLLIGKVRRRIGALEENS